MRDPAGGWLVAMDDRLPEQIDDEATKRSAFLAEAASKELERWRIRWRAPLLQVCHSCLSETTRREDALLDYKTV